MSQGHRIVFDYDSELSKPFTWKGGITQNGRTALIQCENGHNISLSAHKIDEAGYVSPSVVCRFGCDFHEHIILVGWED